MGNTASIQPGSLWKSVEYPFSSPFVPVDLEFLAPYWPMTDVCPWHTLRTRCISLFVGGPLQAAEVSVNC